MGVLALMLAGILVHYTWIAVEVAEIKRLRVENLALRDQGQGVRGERRPAAGQAPGPPGHGQQAGRHGRGRPEPARRRRRRRRRPHPGARRRPPRSTSRRLSAAWTRPSATLTEKSTRLEAFFRDQRQLLASTPSDLAGPRLPLGELRQAHRPVHGPAGLPPRPRHLDADRDEGHRAGRRRRGLLRREERLRQRHRRRPRLRDRHPLRPPRRVQRQARASASGAAT